MSPLAPLQVPLSPLLGLLGPSFSSFEYFARSVGPLVEPHLQDGAPSAVTNNVGPSFSPFESFARSVGSLVKLHLKVPRVPIGLLDV